MRGNRLIFWQFCVMAALALALPAGAQDSPSAVRATAADTSAKKTVADTSAAKRADTSAKASAKISADTAASAKTAVDTSAKIVADTSAKASADTSVKASADTAGALAADSVSADTSLLLTAIPADSGAAKDTAAPHYSSLFTENFEPHPLAGGLDGIDDEDGGIAANWLMIAIFAASLAVIAATVVFFVRKRETRRFLTTTRLSVLDKMVQKGCRCIESNYTDPNLTISAVCKELITGKAYLDALFVKELGISVEDFIAQVRVNSLKIALAEGSSLPQDIENACARCGFANRADAERHFARLVKMGIEGYLGTLK